MNNLQKFGAIAAFSLVSNSAFGAAILTVNVSILRQLFDEQGVALSGGLLGAGNNGDGSVLQVGYYSLATSANLFAGEWTPITGQGSLNSAFNTTVGDGINTGAPNRATFAVTFDLSDSTKNQRLPVAGIPLGIRFFNKTNLAASGLFFETVSNPGWAWLTPNDPPNNPSISISFSDPNAVVQSTGVAVPTTGLRTNTAAPVIPEPSSIALLMIGAASFALNRRRAVKL